MPNRSDQINQYDSRSNLGWTLKATMRDQEMKIFQELT